MKRYDLITPEGTRDLLYEDCIVGKEAGQRIHKIFKSRGYSKVITPGIEFYDVFNCSSQYFQQERLYKLTDSKGRLLVVRPDSTIPIARVASTRLRDNGLPMRLYYSQKVYRVKPSLKGGSDEFLQTGIELIGSPSKRADLEVLTMALEVLSTCDSHGFRLEIGDSGYFRELVNRLDTTDEVKEEIRGIIEAKNYPALNDLLDSFDEDEITATIKALPRLFGGADVFTKARALYTDAPILEILDKLEEIYKSLSKLGYGDNVIMDLGIVNRIDYYTGIIMNGYLDGIGDVVLSGGRYDRLLREFGMDAPATGFAVDVDAVTKLLKKRMGTVPMPCPDVIVYGEDGFEIDALIYSKGLINSGKIVENAVFDSLDDVRIYAKRRGIPHIAVVSDCVELEDV